MEILGKILFGLFAVCALGGQVVAFIHWRKLERELHELEKLEPDYQEGFTKYPGPN